MSAASYRSAAFVFSIVCYGAFLLVFLYLLAFLANLQMVAPRSIDLGRDMGSTGVALAVDIGLMALFGVQHSVMARPGFKRAWVRVVPGELERSAYVLLSSALLALLMWQWRPIPSPVLWYADANWSVALGWAVMSLGIAILLWATFLIDHFELFGLRQGWNALRSREMRGPAFVTPWLYRIVRHPLYLGWLLIFWGTPVMTAGHLLFASVMSGYILVAMRFEERDLVEHIGEPYRRYQQEVPALLPRPGRRSATRRATS
jgi:protein-S-isoprenylcysteine O-methyltransferase Ste14